MASSARFKGGPLDEQDRWVPDEAGWPLPESFTLGLLSDDPAIEVNFMLGTYDKVSESQLTDDQASHPNLVRGAIYEFREVD